eukprot:TRINITY_DN40162_c0_g1_i1.p1 TRINITY_DN40162_c0_g1~~TRINITY_DN40162_c0_g1_i1.p1  ORF type:complete len:418 (+),score=86.41 TRINITY_DN40162_c0_g1_i1:37-1290(+)
MPTLKALEQQGGAEAAWDKLLSGEDGDIKIDKVTLSRMMKTLGQKRNRVPNQRIYKCLDRVEAFIEQSPDQADEVLFNALLEVCNRLQDTQRLDANFDWMKELEVYPSHVTLGIMVKGHGQAGSRHNVLRIWEDMAQQRETAIRQGCSVTFGCMIDACVKCGDLRKALEIFEDLKGRHLHRNTIIYTMLIKGCGENKNLDTALGLFREMRYEQVQCNTMTYNSMLDVCIKCSDFNAANAILGEMRTPHSPVRPDLVTYTTMLKGYCGCGDVRTAMRIADDIKADGLRCDEQVYNTLLDGCAKAKDLALADQLLQEMSQARIRQSQITKQIIRKIYPQGRGSVKRRREEDAEEEAQDQHEDGNTSVGAGGPATDSSFRDSEPSQLCRNCGATVAVSLGFTACSLCGCPELISSSPWPF